MEVCSDGALTAAESLRDLPAAEAIRRMLRNFAFTRREARESVRCSDRKFCIAQQEDEAGARLFSIPLLDRHQAEARRLASLQRHVR